MKPAGVPNSRKRTESVHLFLPHADPDLRARKICAECGRTPLDKPHRTDQEKK